MWQSDLENTKERPLHEPSQDQSKSTVIGGVWKLRNGALYKVLSFDIYLCMKYKKYHKMHLFLVFKSYNKLIVIINECG